MLYLVKITLEGSSYPFKLKKEKIFKSESYVKILKRLNHAVEEKETTERYEIQDAKYELYECYDAQGVLLHRHTPLSDLETFAGNDSPKFKLGEIVEVQDYDELRLGVITGTPVTTEECKSRGWKLDRSDNVYLVDFSKETDEHQHPFEFKMSKPRFPVTETQEKELNEAYKHISDNKLVALAAK